ncbi:MAG: alpha/beta fold hydrolase [Nocardioidaceae bacterium]
MRKLAALVAAAAVVVGIAGTSTAQGVVARNAQTTRAAGYTPPPIHWTDCTDPTLQQFGAQCGRLVVPMSYADPNGRKIKLAVSRVLHSTSDADYQGVMLVNPGGPGGSGLIYSILGQVYSSNLHGAGDAYDWIGFDPRGVGSSTPSISCNQHYFHGDRPPYVPSTSAIMHRWVSRSKGYAADCAHAPGHALLQHVKTTDTVKDMESLRKALGQQQINYYGFSYGTYLGSAYASLHPNRVRRFVFDGTVDPRGVWYQDNEDQDVAFERTINIYFGWLAKYHKVYHVGATRADVRHRYYATLHKLDRHAARGVLGGDELTDVFLSAGYYVYGWEDIAKAWSTYLNKGKPGALINLYKGANPQTAGADNGFAMYLGTQCTDARWPQSQARLNHDNARIYRHHRFETWANAWFNGPCPYWHFGNARPVTIDGSKVASKILMIGETFDAATPFSGSLQVRSLFPTASLIEGKNGTTHAGSLSGVKCTDNAIATYLQDGTVPPRQPGRRSDKLCPHVPRPNPTTSAASPRMDSNRANALARLRQGLLEAQRHE